MESIRSPHSWALCVNKEISMLDMLEKLINEHGSSAILRERLELFSDKYAMLEDKNSHLAERVSELELKLSKANEEITRLNNFIASVEKVEPPVGLSETEMQILKYFFDTNQQLQADHIAQEFNIAVGNAEYHVNKLLELELLYDCLASGEQTRYQIDANGRAYIIENT
jgi:predicted nuclease with TOPRIM domain